MDVGWFHGVGPFEQDEFRLKPDEELSFVRVFGFSEGESQRWCFISRGESLLYDAT